MESERIDPAPGPAPARASGVPEAAPPGSRRLADPGEASAEAIALARELGLSITVADALHRGGRSADDATRRFLEPRLSHLTPPDAMADRDVAAERLVSAIRRRERICVFGDYDCDGITSTAIMTGILRALGGEVVALLATRREGSYGLSALALARVKATGAALLVTCDCGSSDHERLHAARAAGMDVLVIDHHLVPDEPLPVLAFLNPHRPDCGFGYKGLASCGLALSLGAAVRKRLGVDLDVRPWLDLVAIGTIADVAPLSGDNRALVRAGLGLLRSGSRPGLRALAALARLDLTAGVTAEDVAFRIAPRLNAPGRLADPDLALELLLAEDRASAEPLAARVEQLQVERRSLQDAMMASAVEAIERGGYAKDPAILLAAESFHPGIVGIVAGRVASLYGRPTIAVALEGPTGRGSVRGPPGARLYDALSACGAELVGFGGHQAAAGLEVRGDRVEALRDAWRSAFAADAGSLEPRGVEADVRLDERDDARAVVLDLDRLEPCGEANRAPRLLVRGKVRSARDLKGHLKLELRLPNASLGGFGPSLGALARSLGGQAVEVVGRLRRDGYRGGDAVELHLERVGIVER